MDKRWVQARRSALNTQHAGRDGLVHIPAISPQGHGEDQCLCAATAIPRSSRFLGMDAATPAYVLAIDASQRQQPPKRMTGYATRPHRYPPDAYREHTGFFYPNATQATQRRGTPHGSEGGAWTASRVGPELATFVSFDPKRGATTRCGDPARLMSPRTPRSSRSGPTQHATRTTIFWVQRRGSPRAGLTTRTTDISRGKQSGASATPLFTRKV